VGIFLRAIFNIEKMKALIIFLMLFGVTAPALLAQEEGLPLQIVDANEDDLGNVTDEFQENFFEALKQKAIENYERAITALKQCEKLQPENPVVHFEMGKNYKLLEDYDKAISSLQKANRLKPEQEWILAELMESFYENEDYDNAIIIAKNLVPINVKYYDNLADLYFKTNRYEELITLLDRLDAELGIADYRLRLRQQVYALTNNTSAQIEVIQEAIKSNPEKESNYLNLIFVYSEEGMEKEAFLAAENMLEKFPNSRVVHLALYKFYLEAGQPEKAMESMKLVLRAEEIDAESKFRVLNDFLLFAGPNPEYEEELKEVIDIFSEAENSPQVYQKLGEYFLIKNQKDQALEYFEQGLEKDLDNYELLRNTLLLHLDLGNYEAAAGLSEKGMEIFPAQPVLFLIQGVALNEMQEYRKAEEILTFGLDYVIENEPMEADFYEQLSNSYSGMGDAEKASDFRSRAKDLKNKLN
jgi:tetratricopeptide (TPR) repeat protein